MCSTRRGDIDLRMRMKPNLAMRTERCADLLAAKPYALRGRWLSEFDYGELRVELGCGKGLFTVESAISEPGVFFVALEKTANVMITAMERADAAGIQNVRFVNALADVVTDFFAPGEVARIYINFCDPWPSDRHAKRRLTNRRFLASYLQVLSPGGAVHFKTDDLPLFDFSLCEFEQCGFVILNENRDLHKNGFVGVMTDYEAKFYGQGKPIYRCEAVSPATSKRYAQTL